MAKHDKCIHCDRGDRPDKAGWHEVKEESRTKYILCPKVKR